MNRYVDLESFEISGECLNRPGLDLQQRWAIYRMIWIVIAAGLMLSIMERTASGIEISN